MELLCTSSGIVWYKTPKKGITAVKEGGFEEILLDLSARCPAGELEAFGREKQEAKAGLSSQISVKPPKKETIRVSEQPKELHAGLEQLLLECQKASVRIAAARAPYLAGNTKRTDLDGLLCRLAQESIRLCGQAGCRYLIVRPLFAGLARGEEWEANRRYYLGLADIAWQNNVMILLENQCRDQNGNLVRGICSDADEAAAWVDRLNAESGGERFGFCMDVGACSLCGMDMREFAAGLGSRIRAVVLRDCDGIHENALLPFTCLNRGQFLTDWLGLIRGLRETGFDDLLILEFGSMTAAFSQFLRPQLLQFAHGLGEFLKWQIGMKNVLKKYKTRVLFGAGNMCRNFMKCYGEEFPPLFTCDNNQARWGERFEGLTIRPPEACRELPPDCAIFICNVYYKEIEQQLRDMGISNPIEYFNDEYMPSYYFDRLEYWEGTKQ